MLRGCLWLTSSVNVALVAGVLKRWRAAAYLRLRVSLTLHLARCALSGLGLRAAMLKWAAELSAVPLRRGPRLAALLLRARRCLRSRRVWAAWHAAATTWRRAVNAADIRRRLECLKQTWLVLRCATAAAALRARHRCRLLHTSTHQWQLGASRVAASGAVAFSLRTAWMTRAKQRGWEMWWAAWEARQWLLDRLVAAVGLTQHRQLAAAWSAWAERAEALRRDWRAACSADHFRWVSVLPAAFGAWRGASFAAGLRRAGLRALLGTRRHVAASAAMRQWRAVVVWRRQHDTVLGRRRHAAMLAALATWVESVRIARTRRAVAARWCGLVAVAVLVRWRKVAGRATHPARAGAHWARAARIVALGRWREAAAARVATAALVVGLARRGRWRAALHQWARAAPVLAAATELAIRTATGAIRWRQHGMRHAWRTLWAAAAARTQVQCALLACSRQAEARALRQWLETANTALAALASAEQVRRCWLRRHLAAAWRACLAAMAAARAVATLRRRSTQAARGRELRTLRVLWTEWAGVMAARRTAAAVLRSASARVLTGAIGRAWRTWAEVTRMRAWRLRLSRALCARRLGSAWQRWHRTNAALTTTRATQAVARSALTMLHRRSTAVAFRTWKHLMAARRRNHATLAQAAECWGQRGALTALAAALAAFVLRAGSARRARATCLLRCASIIRRVWRAWAVAVTRLRAVRGAVGFWRRPALAAALGSLCQYAEQRRLSQHAWLRAATTVTLGTATRAWQQWRRGAAVAARQERLVQVTRARARRRSAARALRALQTRCWWGAKQAFASERQQLLEACERAEANASELLRVADDGMAREEAVAGSLVAREREVAAAEAAREAAVVEAAATREEAVAATAKAVLATTHARYVAATAEARSEVASEQVHQLHGAVQVPPHPPHETFATTLG